MPEPGHGERGSFAASAFFGALDAERQARRMTWKQGRRPDVDSLAVLVDWAGLRADDFVVRVHGAREASPLAVISAYLKSDRSLTPEAATALEKVVKVTYEALRQP